MDVCGQVGLGGEVFCGPLPRECRLLLEASLGCWGSGIRGGRDPEVLPHPSHPPWPHSAEHPSGLSNTSGALRGGTSVSSDTPALRELRVWRLL